LETGQASAIYNAFVLCLLIFELDSHALGYQAENVLGASSKKLKGPSHNPSILFPGRNEPSCLEIDYHSVLWDEHPLHVIFEDEVW
jgi:hypothetical protein